MRVSHFDLSQFFFGVGKTHGGFVPLAPAVANVGAARPHTFRRNGVMGINMRSLVEGVVSRSTTIVSARGGRSGTDVGCYVDILDNVNKNARPSLAFKEYHASGVRGCA